MTGKPYSLGSARQGLRRFALGRVLVGLAGLALLLLTIRRVAPGEFGAYVSLLALQEIVSLTASLGLFGFVQRYLPEYRLRGSPRQLAGAILFAVAGRILTLGLACGLLVPTGSALVGFLGLPVSPAVFRLYLLVILVEGTGRFIDHIFEALLMQGSTQLSNLTRVLVKLAGLLLIVNSPDWTLHDLILWDAVGSAAALAISVLALGFAAGRRMAQAPDGMFDRRAMTRFAAYNYVALLGYQLYGFDTLKLLVTKLAGVIETAAYGLAQSFADILRRYLPAQLLLGMIRPLVIASYAQSKDMSRPLFLANLVLKLNLFLIAPALAVFIAIGAPLLELVAKGRYPQAYGYVLAFIVLVAVQTLHLMLTVLAMTVERNDLVMKGTWIALVGTVCALLAVPLVGAWGALAAAYASELSFCAVVAGGLRLACNSAVVRWREYRMLGANFAVAAACGALVPLLLPATTAMLLAGACLICAAYFSLALYLKPFSSQERETINRLLPKPVFVW